MLIRTETGAPRHIEAVPYVESVPSKRDATAAYAELIAALPCELAETMGRQIEIIRDFLWSR